MDYCCQRFDETVSRGELVRSEAGAESAWELPPIGGIDYCPFCGADVTRFVETVEDEPDMSSLEGLFRRIGEAAYFSGIEVTSPNTLGMFSTTPLHIAALWGECEAIRMLVDAGADINAHGEYGFTPLMEAVSQGDMDAVKLLIELGAEPLENEDGHSPSEFAALMNHSELECDLKAKGY